MWARLKNKFKNRTTKANIYFLESFARSVFRFKKIKFVSF